MGKRFESETRLMEFAFMLRPYFQSVSISNCNDVIKWTNCTYWVRPIRQFQHFLSQKHAHFLSNNTHTHTKQRQSDEFDCDEKTNWPSFGSVKIATINWFFFCWNINFIQAFSVDPFKIWYENFPTLTHFYITIGFFVWCIWFWNLLRFSPWIINRINQASTLI